MKRNALSAAMETNEEASDPLIKPDTEERNWELISQGAEAKIWSLSLGGRPAIAKERFQKAYRHPDLDLKLTKRRVLGEARCLSKCRRAGMDTPTLFLVDLEKNRIFMEKINGSTVKSELTSLYQPSEGYGEGGVALASAIGFAVAKMHNCGIIHGDLTTSNMFIRTNSSSIVLIDFGLGHGSNSMHEDKAVDLYVMERALASTHANSQPIMDEVLRVYKAQATRSDAIMQKLAAVRQRGRKRECFG